VVRASDAAQAIDLPVHACNPSGFAGIGELAVVAALDPDHCVDEPHGMAFSHVPLGG
jgi:hypothetical protein